MREGLRGNAMSSPVKLEATAPLRSGPNRAVQPVTRDAVHTWLGREVTRREWVKVDDRLRLAPFQYKVSIAAGSSPSPWLQAAKPVEASSALNCMASCSR